MPYPPINPYMSNPYMQQAIIPPAVQQMIQQPTPVMQQQAGVSIKVSGRDEAMNRLLMMYPASVLVPGFTSDALFDIDGRHFHALSIEPDGRRNLETFSYQLESTPTQLAASDYVSRTEFQELADKINQMMGDADGIPQPVQPASAAANKPA